MQQGAWLTVKELERLIFRLPSADLHRLAERIQAHLETHEMMALAEGGFAEWDDPEEERYDLIADPSSR